MGFGDPSLTLRITEYWEVQRGIGSGSPREPLPIPPY